uniref:Methyltransferase domain-containing protein n=1 Tax=viral metagenome TaxID=1070528 RepID=A0A6C0HNS3_9ZZZZ
MNKFTIYGERCSGTKYLEELVLLNFDVVIVWDYGLKHFFGFSDLTNSDDVLFIGIVRNLDDWINSLYREKHHLPTHLTENIDTFLTDTFYSITAEGELMEEDINIDTGERYKNIYELRLVKNKYLIEKMPKLVKNYCLITHDDLVDSFVDIMNKLKNFGLKIKDSIDFPLNVYYNLNDKLSLFKKKENIIPKEKIIIENEELKFYEKILFPKNWRFTPLDIQNADFNDMKEDIQNDKYVNIFKGDYERPDKYVAKNSIFCCVFNQEKYVDMFLLLLESIFIYGNLDDNTNILVYTSTPFMNKIKQSHLFNNKKIKFEINDTYNNIDKACKARLDLFNLPSIKNYNKILYLDTDILVKDDINKIFDVCKEDILYVLEEGSLLLDQDYWGRILFGNEINNYNDKSAFTSGILLFNNCEKIKDLFNKINQDIVKRPYKFSCYDQPYIVYNAFKYNLYNNKVLKSLVVNGDNNVRSDKVIHHFPGGAGVYQHKINEMIIFLNRLKNLSNALIHKLLSDKFTLVSNERLKNLHVQCSKFKYTNYSFVECGVAKGGCLAMMKFASGENNKIFGFDSFEGMPNITKEDLDDDYNKSCPLTDLGNLSGGITNVYNTFDKLSLNMNNVKLVKGFFQDTLQIKENIDNIGEIAVLRLDGDWYESTKICLDKLYDSVIEGGIIIIDDYGHFVGAKRAVDEFRKKYNILNPLIKTDYTEHYWIKEKQNYSELCVLGKKYNVDKSPFFGRHTFTPEYHNLLKDKKYDINKVLEIGIGNIPLMYGLTNNNYRPGPSLRMWREYFPNANIIGCDILEDVLFNEERISTFQTDQSNEISLNKLISNIGDVDLIIDDGSHIQEHMVTSFKNLWKIIKPNGLYIIEDIHISFLERMIKLNDELKLFDSQCIKYYKGIFESDNFVVFQKISIFDTRNEMLQNYCYKLSSPKLLEIGVFKGDFLNYLINNCNIGSIDAVDLFYGDTCSGDVDGNNVIYYNVGKSYLELSEKYKDALNIKLHKSNSITFLQNQEDNKYDIIYIDGDHSYNGVKNDLINSYNKIKNGGYIMGHDYEMNMKKANNNYNFGVKQAVDEFCINYKQSIISKANDGCVSYCIRINKI